VVAFAGVASELNQRGPKGQVKKTVNGFFDDLAERDVEGACDKLSAHGRTLLIKHKVRRPLGATQATCVESAALPKPPAGLGADHAEESDVEIAGNAARVEVVTGREFDLGDLGEDLPADVREEIFGFDSVLHLRKGDEGWKIEKFRLASGI